MNEFAHCFLFPFDPLFGRKACIDSNIRYSIVQLLNASQKEVRRTTWNYSCTFLMFQIHHIIDARKIDVLSFNVKESILQHGSDCIITLLHTFDAFLSPNFLTSLADDALMKEKMQKKRKRPFQVEEKLSVPKQKFCLPSGRIHMSAIVFTKNIKLQLQCGIFFANTKHIKWHCGNFSNIESKK